MQCFQDPNLGNAKYFKFKERYVNVLLIYFKYFFLPDVQEQ